MIGADDPTIGDRVASEYDQLPGATKQEPRSVVGTVCLWVLIASGALVAVVVGAHGALRLVEWAWRLS